MRKDEYQITLLILSSASADQIATLKNTVSAQAVICRTATLSEVDKPGIFDDVNALLVDCRDVALPLPSLPANMPAIALLESAPKEASITENSLLDDIVSETELATPFFLLRLKRQLARYRAPVALNRLSCPEFELVKAITDNAADWIFVKDLYHRFLFVSNNFAAATGLSMDQIIGKDDLEIGTNEVDVYGSPELGWQGFWAQDDDAIAGGVPTVELNSNWRAVVGQVNHQRCLRYPLRNNAGEVYALLVISTNVTRPEDNTLDINARSQMLDRVLGEMHKAQESRKLAEQAENAKNKLLAAASHDLRQPLHAMGLFLNLLERRVQGEEELDLIANIKRGSNALSTLFNSLLDVSQLDADVVTVNETDFQLEDLLGNLRGEFEAIGLQKSLAIDIPYCKDVIRTDAVLLERILRNLVQNAVTYTQSGSVVVSSERRRGKLDIFVIDTGPGIPVNEQEFIFSEYYQVKGTAETPTKGLGLGLAIVHRLVDLMDLDIDLQSDVGQGARFCVTVPLGQLPLAPTVTTRPEVQNLAGKIVLIIDDEIDIREGMARVLRKYDTSAVTAESASQALILLTEIGTAPDLIVADYRLMAGETGDQAIKLVREYFNTEIPALIVTGDTAAGKIKAVARSKLQTLHKPVQPARLISVISEMLIPEKRHSGNASAPDSG